MRDGQEDVDFAEVVTAAAATSTSGPSARLVPEASVALAVALHEFATDAAEYGALGRRDGRRRAFHPLLRRDLPFRGPALRGAAAHLPHFAAAAACDALQPLRRRAALWPLALHDSAGTGSP